MSVERDKLWKAWTFTFETREGEFFAFRLEDFMFQDSELLVGHVNFIIEKLIEELLNDN